ncbi:MAG TPA: hypothetical protein VFM02_00625 [Candidatus Paceibacterota bacterium]|nr:hypothetical protein [Candidatus Paceibacterota bacterium]
MHTITFWGITILALIGSALLLLSYDSFEEAKRLKYKNREAAVNYWVHAIHLRRLSVVTFCGGAAVYFLL